MVESCVYHQLSTKRFITKEPMRSHLRNLTVFLIWCLGEKVNKIITFSDCNLTVCLRHKKKPRRTMTRTHCSQVMEEKLARMGAMMAMIAEQDCELTDKNKPSYLSSSTEYIVYTLLTASLTTCIKFNPISYGCSDQRLF